jgi:hypothetical protein
LRIAGRFESLALGMTSYHAKTPTIDGDIITVCATLAWPFSASKSHDTGFTGAKPQRQLGYNRH